eukprot:2836741-Rhodomonas_salina.5
MFGCASLCGAAGAGSTIHELSTEDGIAPYTSSADSTIGYVSRRPIAPYARLIGDCTWSSAVSYTHLRAHETEADL